MDERHLEHLKSATGVLVVDDEPGMHEQRRSPEGGGRSARSAAFGELVQRHQERLYNCVYRLLGNHEDACDVVQDAFLNAYQSLDSFKRDSLLFTWLYRIAVNTAISFERKKRAMVRIDTTGNPRIEPLDPSEETRPGHSLEQAEQEQRIQQALTRLSAKHRAVLILKDVEGQKYEEMAEALDLPLGTIRSRLYRARLELRGILEMMDEGSK